MDNKKNFSVTAVLSLISFFIPDLPLVYRIVIFLIVIIFGLTYALWCSQKRLKSITKEYEDVSVKHKALASQYDLKVNSLRNYEFILENLCHSILIAQQSNNDEKLRVLLDQFYLLQKYLNDGGN